MVKKIIKLILKPFKWIANKIKERREEIAKSTRLDLTRDFIRLAKDEKLELMITANYDHDLIVNLMTKDAKKGMIRKKKANEKKESKEENN